MFSASLSKNKSYFIVVEGNNKDHEFNAFFLELGCEQVSLYSVISSTKNMGRLIYRLGDPIFSCLKRT